MPKLTTLPKPYKRLFDYFALFQFTPTLGDVHRYIEMPCSQKAVRNDLYLFVSRGLIEQKTINRDKTYCLKGKSAQFQIRKSRVKHSKNKIEKAYKIAHLLSYIPQILFIGLSGSVSMQNATRKDDIDFFIIAEKGKLWTTRLLILFVLHFMGVLRKRKDKRVDNKICCNMFFDGTDIYIPQQKQSYFTAHELLHMVPLYSRGGEYQKLLKKNNWIYSIYPNTKNTGIQYKSKGNHKSIYWLNYISLGERIFSFFQKKLIAQHTTGEYITDTQLWFFPADISKKLPVQFTRVVQSTDQ